MSKKIGRIRQINLEKIFAAAEEEFAKEGFKGASMQRIADRVALPRTNVHYYFNNKQTLYGSLLQRIVRIWNDAFDQIRAEDDPETALENYIRAKLRYSRDRPLASRIFANEMIHGAPHIGDYLHQELREWLALKASVIQQWIDQGRMDPIDPLQLIFMIWSTTQHYADFAVQVCAVMGKQELSGDDYERIADTVCHVILKGCGLRTRCATSF